VASLPTIAFRSRKEWSAWLAKHHDSSAGLWMRIAKAGTKAVSITYGEALEEALRYGWIDGQKKSADGETWLQRFTPRGPRSIWSTTNRAKAERLVASGLMTPAGLRAVEAARASGRWATAYDSPASAGVPPDLRAAIDRSPGASKFFATLDSHNRYALIHRTQTARKAETRARRIAGFVEMLERGEKIYP
jgi:uncharacterized protein YdeI (YjbR/CyaY-like superfamily)